RDRLRIKEAESRLRNMRPDAVIASKKMRLLDMEDALKRLMAEQLSQNRLGLTDTGRRLRDAMTKKHSDRKHEVALYAERLKRISPLEKLTMGYSFVTDDTGRNVRDVTKIKEGDGINVYMLNGKVSADVKRVEKNDD
ncbi:MAG: hypothetical protein K6G42_06055, partial [Lachnospiraceae bacterium]|nr:hypothetical protein [Lachnospiraceae bacterium]